MRICIISFDIWGFDNYIQKELLNKQIEAHHIALSQYKYEYKNGIEKVKNFYAKLFLNKNIKHLNREKFILNELERLGHFDQILIINPELISLDTHTKIKTYTDKYITFLYDSLERYFVKKEILNLFDKIFSFDTKDCQKYDFEFITNYIYETAAVSTNTFKYKAFCILSEDNRVKTLFKINTFFERLELPSKFIVFSRINKSESNSNISYTNKRISIKEVSKLLNDSEIFIDLIRDNQTGLSFRVFESLGLQRKLITTNESIKDFDFYKADNILIIDKNNPEVSESFLNSDYKPVPSEIIEKYSISNWCKRVFSL